MTFLQLIANLGPDGTFANGTVADPRGAYTSALLLDPALAERIRRAIGTRPQPEPGVLLTERGERRKPLEIWTYARFRVDLAGPRHAANDDHGADRDQAHGRQAAR